MKLDADIKKMTPGQLRQALMKARRAIRTHKKKSDNARCWMSDDQLYDQTLPEGRSRAGHMNLSKEVLLGNCARYIDRQKRRLQQVTVSATQKS